MLDTIIYYLDFWGYFAPDPIVVKTIKINKIKEKKIVHENTFDDIQKELKEYFKKMNMTTK